MRGCIVRVEGHGLLKIRHRSCEVARVGDKASEIDIGLRVVRRLLDRGVGDGDGFFEAPLPEQEGGEVSVGRLVMGGVEQCAVELPLGFLGVAGLGQGKGQVVVDRRRFW